MAGDYVSITNFLSSMNGNAPSPPQGLALTLSVSYFSERVSFLLGNLQIFSYINTTKSCRLRSYIVFGIFVSIKLSELRLVFLGKILLANLRQYRTNHLQKEEI